MMAPGARSLALMALHAGAHCTVVTLGRRGVVYFASPSVMQIVRGESRSVTNDSGVFRTAVMPPDEIREGPGVDPTGCGDVWGSTFFARLLDGAEFNEAMRAANRAAGRNVEFRGVRGLSAFLRGAAGS
jgi:sugar/nucleoside kinase (ribokinase family)